MNPIKPYSSLESSFNKFLITKYSTYKTWMTITFREPTTQDIAKQKLRAFFMNLNKSDNDSSQDQSAVTFFEKYVKLFVFYEKDKERKRNSVHLHVLADRIDVSKLDLLEKKCLAFFGPQCVVKLKHENVAPYLAEKYNKDELLHYEPMTVNVKPSKNKNVLASHASPI